MTTSTLLPAKEFSPPKIPFLDAVATLILNGSRPVRSEFGELPSLPGYEVLGVLGHGGGGMRKGIFGGKVPCGKKRAGGQLFEDLLAGRTGLDMSLDRGPLVGIEAVREQ